jgi:hypothetical protein
MTNISYGNIKNVYKIPCPSRPFGIYLLEFYKHDLSKDPLLSPAIRPEESMRNLRI